MAPGELNAKNTLKLAQRNPCSVETHRILIGTELDLDIYPSSIVSCANIGGGKKNDPELPKSCAGDVDLDERCFTLRFHVAYLGDVGILTRI